MIIDEWRSYREQVVPKDASSVQVQECRRAFFAGALAMRHLFETSPDDDAEQWKFFDAIEKEFQDFKQDVLDGVQ